MKMNKAVMIVGVGGQGTLLASRILGSATLKRGYDVKVSEVHGMSQRGGSVVTYVKYGDKIASPIIEKGEADMILAFEPLEAARWLEYLKLGGKIIVDTHRIEPVPVIMGAAEYPADIIGDIRATGASVEEIDATSLALAAGTVKAANVVLIGAVAKRTDIISKEKWIEVLKEYVPSKLLEINLKAFESGYACNF